MAVRQNGEFEALLRTGPVRAWLGAFQMLRLITLALAGLVLAAGIAAGVALWFQVPQEEWQSGGWTMVGFIVAMPFVVPGAALLASLLVRRRKARLKGPVLEAIARAKNMTYRADCLETPIGDETLAWLIGPWVPTLKTYTDLFHGFFPDRGGFMFFDAFLLRGHGRNAHVAFKGTIYAYGRAAPDVHTVIWNPTGFANYARPTGPAPRIRIEGDPEIDDRFEVFSTDANEAKRLLTRTALGRFLIEQAQSRRIDCYIGQHLAVLGVGGRDRFEVGALLGWRGGKARARRMYDEVEDSQQVLRRFRELAG